VKGQQEKMSRESCLKLTAPDGRGVKVKWQWVPDNWSCDEEAPPSKPSCSGWWKISVLGWAETRTAWTVSDCVDNATEVGRPGASDAVRSRRSGFELYPLRHRQPMEDVTKQSEYLATTERTTQSSDADWW